MVYWYLFNAWNETKRDTSFTNKIGWYIIGVQYGHDENVKKDIENLHDLDIKEVIVPKIKTIKYKNHERIENEELASPGYVFIKMVFTEDVWYKLAMVDHLIVTNDHQELFHYKPIPTDQVKKFFKNLNGENKKVKKLTQITIGESIKPTTGPFMDKILEVQEIEDNNIVCKVQMLNSTIRAKFTIDEFVKV